MTDWKKSLYTFGYCLTTEPDRVTRAIPDISNWNRKRICNYTLFVHPDQKYHVYDAEDGAWLLVGHAYNPFTMEKDETEILRHLSGLPFETEEYRAYFDQLSGVFFFSVIRRDSVIATCDCAGMLGANYAVIDGQPCFSAYSQMIADIYGLKEDSYVTKLKKSKLFHWYGWYLPGDRTPYSEVRRIIPNTEVVIGTECRVFRFYPRKPYAETSEADYPDRVRMIGSIMHNSLLLVTEKWTHPAISLTGGTDSKTTLACARGIQDRFRYFSYVSLPREETDAFAARDICKELGLRHTIYNVDPDPAAYPEYEEVSRLLERHYAYLGKANPNDICKRISLRSKIDFDVEVKSWVSEVARASRYEKYRKKSFPRKIRPRYLTSMYKIFGLDRGNALRTDRQFRQYLDQSGLGTAVYETGYPWTEFFVWEIVFGGWGGLALTGEHMLTNEITVPYNNRALLDLMLRTPLEKRMHDRLHKDIMHEMDERIERTGIHVVNGNETKRRALLERLYYDIHNHLPL